MTLRSNHAPTRTTVAPLQRAPRGRSRSRPRHRILTHAVLTLYCLFAIVPVVFLVLASLKSTSSFFRSPFSLPRPLEWSNYSNAWHQANLPSAFINSTILAAVSVTTSTVASVCAAYAVVRLRQRSGGLQLLFVFGLLIPAPVLIIPMYLLMKWLHLTNTLGSIIVPYVGILIPFAFLVYVNFMRTIPASIGEAAQVDGASTWQRLWKIEFPLLKPATSAVVILNTVFVWNDFLLPLVLGTRDSLHTLPVAIVSFFGVYQTSWGLVFASVVLSALPVIVLYVAYNRRFIDGIVAGSIR